MKALKRKLKSRAGLTLVEMLCTTAIVVIVTAGVVTTISLGLTQYQKSLRTSQSKVLASTLQTIISNELTYTTEINTEADGTVTSFQSQNYTLTDKMGTLAPTSDYGYITISGEKVLSDAAYTKGLRARVETFTYDSKNHLFTVTLVLGYKGEPYLTRTFQVPNANEIGP